MPRMPLSGVRSSCVSVANNVVLARSASSAARTWRVMSRALTRCAPSGQDALDPFEAPAIGRGRIEAAFAVLERRRLHPAPGRALRTDPLPESEPERRIGAQQRAVRREDGDRIGQRLEGVECMCGQRLSHGARSSRERG